MEKLPDDKRVDIFTAINRAGDEVNSTLNEKKEGMYFQAMVLLYSLIENLIKMVTLMQLLWNKTEGNILDGEAQTLRKFVLNSYYATVVKLAYSIGLVDYPLFQKLIRLKGRRDDIIHQFWLYSHRNDAAQLRKELEELAEASNSLIGIFNKLSKQIGVDEVYDFVQGKI